MSGPETREHRKDSPLVRARQLVDELARAADETAAAEALAKDAHTAVKKPPGVADGGHQHGAASTVQPTDDVDPIEAAREAIRLHEKKDSSRSLLGRAFGYIYGADERSLADLKKLVKDYDRAIKTGDQGAAEAIRRDLAGQLDRERKYLQFQDDLSHYGSSFVKTATLFMRGRTGFLGTAASYALDQINPSERLSIQALDGLLGAAKGVALKGVFHKLGQAEVGIAVKGVGLGVGSRLVDLALSRQSYVGTSGSMSFAQGMSEIGRGTLSKEALLTDVVVFGLAHGLVKGGNSISGGAIERSPLATTMLTAGSFGLLSGSSAEVHMQLSSGKTLTTMDYGRIAKAGFVQGAVDLLAGAPGGLQARAALRRAEQHQTVTQADGAEQRLARTAARVFRGDSVANQSGESSLADAQVRLAETGFEKHPLEADRQASLELWEPERDITRYSAEEQERLGLIVRSGLWRRAAGRELAERLLKVTSGWQEDLTPQFKEVEDSKKTYEAAVERAKSEVLDTDAVGIREFGQTDEARAALADRPELLRIYDQYLDRRDKYWQALDKLNKALEIRRAEMEGALNSVAQAQGLPAVKLKLYEDLGMAGAQYSVGQGIISLRRVDLKNTADTSGVVRKLSHELTHAEQDMVMIKSLADELGVGKSASVEQLDLIIALFKERTAAPAGDLNAEGKAGAHLDRDFLLAVLKQRDGVPLSDGQRARAQELFAANRLNKPVGPEFAELGNHFRMTARELARLDKVNSGYLLTERLALVASGVLSEHLFGSREPPPEVKEFIKQMRRFNEDMEADWSEHQVRSYYQQRLRERLESINRSRRKAYEEYMAGIHEKEAWLVAERVRLLAEMMGATTQGQARLPTSGISELRKAAEAILEDLSGGQARDP